MGRPTALVALAHIVDFLRERAGKEYTAKQLAHQFRTSPSSIATMYRNLEQDGWRVEKDRFTGTTFYRAWPPQVERVT